MKLQGSQELRGDHGFFVAFALKQWLDYAVTISDIEVLVSLTCILYTGIHEYAEHSS